MNVKLVHTIPPSENNPRNSEGSFLRSPNGDILFAYSRYTGDNPHDHSPCDIVMIRSTDEGDSWSAPVVIAEAKDFGVANLMSVSGVVQNDGSIGFYFLIKENDYTTSIGRTLSTDGVSFTASRCECKFTRNYYVINNDRFERLADGRIVAPAAYISADDNRYGGGCYISTCLVSSDDGATFTRTRTKLSLSYSINEGTGMQEPGVIELYPGVTYLWARTSAGFQFKSVSVDNLSTFSLPEPSIFTSPESPLEMIRADANTIYAIYNPIPNYNGKEKTAWGWGRTPIVIRKSTNNGQSFGKLNVVEGDPNVGYCYPALFITNDGNMLSAYCAGGEADKMCLCRINITKFPLSEIE